MKHHHHLLVAFSFILSASAASAHITYGGVSRDLGPSTGNIPGVISGAGVTPYFKTITTQTVTSDFGWAVGTDADLLGDAHHTKAYRFTLGEGGLVTLKVAAAAARNSGTGSFLPAFSIYSGLVHTSGGSDYDTSPISQAYLSSLGGTQPKRGAFNALDTWKIGNDAGTTFADLSTLTYLANAADGTFSNFGVVSGINGDGLADGIVEQTLWLEAGNYSLFVGGANATGTNTGNFGIDVSLSAIPEPTFMLLGAVSSLAFFGRRRRP